MTTITQSITALPTAPDPATQTPAAFSTTAAAFVLAQKTMATEIETWRGQANTVAGEINTAVSDTEAAQTAAENASAATLWVSGSFSSGDVRWSPTDYQTYRKVGGSGGTTDPALDLTNWTKISGGGAARILSAASDTSPLAWNSDLYDTTILTAQAEALTISADAGTAQYSGKRHLFIFKDNATPRALTWTTGATKAFSVIGTTLPTTTISGKWVYVGCVWNATADRWHVIAVGQET